VQSPMCLLHIYEVLGFIFHALRLASSLKARTTVARQATVTSYKIRNMIFARTHIQTHKHHSLHIRQQAITYPAPKTHYTNLHNASDVQFRNARRFRSLHLYHRGIAINNTGPHGPSRPSSGVHIDRKRDSCQSLPSAPPTFSRTPKRLQLQHLPRSSRSTTSTISLQRTRTTQGRGVCGMHCCLRIRRHPRAPHSLRHARDLEVPVGVISPHIVPRYRRDPGGDSLVLLVPLASCLLLRGPHERCN
jgi:hypothetical protein